MSDWARFPKTRFVDESDIDQQLRHLKSEVKEVEIAIYTRSVSSIIEELFDVIHSAETLIRMLEKYNIDIDEIKGEVVKKNRERGYYD